MNDYIVGFAFDGGKWQVLYCVEASPDDPPVFCGSGILETRSVYPIVKGAVLRPYWVLLGWLAWRQGGINDRVARAA